MPRRRARSRDDCFSCCAPPRGNRSDEVGSNCPTRCRPGVWAGSWEGVRKLFGRRICDSRAISFLEVPVLAQPLQREPAPDRRQVERRDAVQERRREGGRLAPRRPPSGPRRGRPRPRRCRPGTGITVESSDTLMLITSRSASESGKPSAAREEAERGREQHLGARRCRARAGRACASRAARGTCCAPGATRCSPCSRIQLRARLRERHAGDHRQPRARAAERRCG